MLLTLGLLLSMGSVAASAQPPSSVVAVAKVANSQWQAAHWVAAWPQAEQALINREDLAALNARQFRDDPSLNDLSRIEARIAGEALRARILAISKRPAAARYDAAGKPINERGWRRLQRALAVDAIGDSQPVRFALLTRRAALRAFPTTQRAFSAVGDTDIDRFQESALFPGEPVAVLHASRDGRWRFVIAANYSAWVEANALAYGTRETVLDYATRRSRMITGAEAHLAFTPEQPVLSRLRLEMGTALPELRDWPFDRAVNGQGALGSHVVEVPLRDAQGTLRIVPALLPRGADSHDGPLPASRANLLRQAFKFLGERYGWGHDHAGRDCSGLIAEVYRSLGIALPRNTSDQARSTAFQRRVFAADAPRVQRLAAVRALAPGDLIYLPGHVVMVIGHDSHGPWVIHDVNRGRLMEAAGLREIPLNGVSIAPLLALRFDAQRDYLDAATVIQRILPGPE